MTDRGHRELAVAAARQADLALEVMPAVAAMSLTLVDFLTGPLRDHHRHAVRQVDRSRPAPRHSSLRWISMGGASAAWGKRIMRRPDPCALRIQNSEPMAISEMSPTTAVEGTERPVTLWAERIAREVGSRSYGVTYDAAKLGAGLSVRAVHARTDGWRPEFSQSAHPMRTTPTLPPFPGRTVLRTMRDHL